MSRWGVALVGCGTVGGGTAGILTDSAALLESRTGSSFPLVSIVDKDFSRARALGLDPSLFKTSLDEVLRNPDVQVVIELAGGTGFAKTVVQEALKAGKHVVTANKALLATFGPELFSLARSRKKTIGFEASCAGAIPIVRTLAEDLVANQIHGLSGIVNGTCNFILSQMTSQGLSYATALKQAQEQGFAEADPFLDVSGTDSAHKLVLLTSVAMGIWADWNHIPLRGLEAVTVEDLEAAAALGARVKLLARTEKTGAGYRFSVEPTVVAPGQALSTLEGPFNGVLVHGNETGFLYFQGRGAGARPTASAVVSDLAALATGTLENTQTHYSCWPDLAAPVNPMGDEESRGPWFVYGPGRPPEIVEDGSRTRLAAEGLRVFPWYDPRERA